MSRCLSPSSSMSATTTFQTTTMTSSFYRRSPAAKPPPTPPLHPLRCALLPPPLCCLPLPRPPAPATRSVPQPHTHIAFKYCTLAICLWRVKFFVLFSHPFCLASPRTLMARRVRRPSSSLAGGPAPTEKSQLSSITTERRATPPALHRETTREERYAQLHLVHHVMHRKIKNQNKQKSCP